MAGAAGAVASGSLGPQGKHYDAALKCVDELVGQVEFHAGMMAGVLLDVLTRRLPRRLSTDPLSSCGFSDTS